jgi:hypothetical protein
MIEHMARKGLMKNPYKIDVWVLSIVMSIEEIGCEYDLGSFGSG